MTQTCRLEKSFPHRLFANNFTCWIWQIDLSTPKAKPISRSRRFSNDRQAPATFPFQSGAQTEPITVKYVGTHEQQTTNNEVKQLCVQKKTSSECPSTYVSRSSRQFGKHMIRPKGAVRRREEISLLDLHCPTTGNAFNWDILFSQFSFGGSVILGA